MRAIVRGAAAILAAVLFILSRGLAVSSFPLERTLSLPLRLTLILLVWAVFFRWPTTRIRSGRKYIRRVAGFQIVLGIIILLSAAMLGALLVGFPAPAPVFFWLGTSTASAILCLIAGALLLQGGKWALLTANVLAAALSATNLPIGFLMFWVLIPPSDASAVEVPPKTPATAEGSSSALPNTVLPGPGARDEDASPDPTASPTEDADAEEGYRLGLAYLMGRGVHTDDTAAIKFLHRSALRGHPEAQLTLGAMYADGRGGWPNPVQAFRWLQLASINLPESAIAQREEATAGLARVRSRMTFAQIEEAKRLVAQREATRLS